MKKKISKEKKEQFKKFKKQREKLFLPEKIKNLPHDLQKIIYFIVLSKYNKQWFNEHRSKFTSNINHFQVDLNRFINRNSKRSYWLGDPDLVNKNTSIIEKVPVYKNQERLCNKKIDKCQQFMLTAFFTSEEKEKFNLPKLHEYKNSKGTFWFHEKCRCNCCDRIKIACLQTKTIFYKTEKKEYGSLQKKVNYFDYRGWPHSIQEGMSGEGGFIYIDHEDNKILHDFHKKFKGIQINDSNTWITKKSYLDYLKKLYNPY